MFAEKKPILAHLPTTRQTRTRHLLIGTVGSIFACLAVVAAFGSVSGEGEISMPQRDVVESLALSQAALVDESDALFIREEKVRPGDSAASLFDRLGIEDTQLIDTARGDVRAQPLFRQLSPGKTVTAYLDRSGRLHSLIFPLNDKQDQALELDNTTNGLQITQKVLALDTRVIVKSADISYSLFGATDAAGIPDGIASQLVDIFGGDIDFHRDLRKGDHFSVAYEAVTHHGRTLRSGRILAAEFINDGHSFKAVWFDAGNGQGGYYTPDGKSLRKSFLRSPLEFSRVTSGFSLARFHPILQKWKAHKGVDYGAPIGTHVKATGDAVVEFVGVQNGYGKVIILKHQGPYTTLYGHLSGFAPGIHQGSRVAQGDVIAYTGQTGYATGPHLHYEFRIDGVFKNPLSVALPGSPPMPTEQMPRFRRESLARLGLIDVVRNVNLATSE